MVVLVYEIDKPGISFKFGFLRFGIACALPFLGAATGNALLFVVVNAAGTAAVILAVKTRSDAFVERKRQEAETARRREDERRAQLLAAREAKRHEIEARRQRGREKRQQALKRFAPWTR